MSQYYVNVPRVWYIETITGGQVHLMELHLSHPRKHSKIYTTGARKQKQCVCQKRLTNFVLYVTLTLTLTLLIHYIT